MVWGLLICFLLFIHPSHLLQLFQGEIKEFSSLPKRLWAVRDRDRAIRSDKLQQFLKRFNLFLPTISSILQQRSQPERRPHLSEHPKEIKGYLHSVKSKWAVHVAFEICSVRNEAPAAHLSACKTTLKSTCPQRKCFSNWFWYKTNNYNSC